MTTLQNAFRILRPGGRVIIMDSPTYHLDNNGRKMIEERSLYLQNQYNIKNAPTAGKGYLVLAETLKAFHDTGFHTNVHWLEKPAKWWKWLFTRTKAARVQQELVRFPLLIGTKQKNLRLQSRHQPCQQYQYQAE